MKSAGHAFGMAALLCGVMPLLGIGLGIAAILMGRGDLQQIDAGTMDPDGRGQTKGGIICGIIGIVCGFLIIGCGVAFFIFLIAAGGMK